jgi:putative oxidoreductase
LIDSIRSIHERGIAAAQRIAWLPPLATRVAVGCVFASAGWAKLHNLDRVIEFFDSLGIPMAQYQAPFVAATEWSCGLLLVVGLGTRFAALPLMVTMLVAIRTAIWPEVEGLIDLLGREESLLFVLLGWLTITGAGAVSIDALASRRLRSPESRGQAMSPPLAAQSDTLSA